MTPEEIVESLVEKFDGANDIIANYLVHKSLEFDDCIVMGSCDIVFDLLTLICAHNFDMYNFHEALEDLHSYMKKYGIKAFEWSPDDDDIVEKENITCANLRDIFYAGEDIATDEEAAQKAGERKHVYFSLGHIQYIHENFVCEQFHSIDPHDLYAILNLLDCDKRLKIREGEKNRVYYFINVVGNLVQTDLQLNWRKSICQHLGLSYKAYNSKYKEAEDSENPRTVAFREKIEELIENFDELAKAS